MRKTFAVFVAIATLMALAVPASAARGGRPNKPSKATVSIDTNLFWSAHEVGDLIIYYVSVVNNTGGVVFVEDSLTLLSEEVEAGQSAWFEFGHYVEADDFIDPAVIGNRATVVDASGDLLASDAVEIPVWAYEECDSNGDGIFDVRPPGYSVCIWHPAQHGD